MRLKLWQKVLKHHHNIEKPASSPTATRDYKC